MMRLRISQFSVNGQGVPQMQNGGTSILQKKRMTIRKKTSFHFPLMSMLTQVRRASLFLYFLVISPISLE